MPISAHIVTASHSGKRLDLFIAHHESHLSRTRIQEMIRDGRALVNGAVEKPGYTVKAGDRVALELPERIVHETLPENIPLNVIFEDSHMLVLNKPPGIVVHPAPGNYQGTLVNALLFHYGGLPAAGAGAEGGEWGTQERAGIVHRLDKDTSGVLVVARTVQALAELSAQFKARVVKKKYLALVAGVIKKGSGAVESPIGRHVKDRKKISVHTKTPREAITLYTVKERFGNATLVEVEIKTGRTHQIRVHLAHLGHPVLGDVVYGGRKSESPRGIIFPRQMLHAEALSLLHPATGHPMTFIAPMPQDMSDIVASLRRPR